jgi:uncharacterized membrane protein
MNKLILLGLFVVFCIVWLAIIFITAKKEDRKVFIEMLKEIGKKFRPLLKEINKNE